MKSNIFLTRMCLLALGCLIPLSVSVEAATEPEEQNELTAFMVGQPIAESTGEMGTASILKPQDGVEKTESITKVGPKKPAGARAYPIKIEADSMYYSNKTGAVRASGNVIAKQGPQTLTTELLEGNQKENLYYMPGSGRLQDGTMDMIGNVVSYNSLDKRMTMQDGEGLMRPYYVVGSDIDYDQTIGHMKKGMLTTEHAMAWKNPPDYRVEGENIVMIPNDRLTIKEAKFFIRNWHIMTLKSYTTSLKDSKSSNLFSLMPSPNYDSDNGFSLKGKTAFPAGENGELYFNYAWYSKVGFKPDIGYRHYFPWGGATFGYKKEESTINDRNVWIEKRPELNVWTRSYWIGNTPFNVRFNGSVGQWIQGSREGSHQMINGVINHKPLYLGNDLTFNAALGYKKDWYSYQDVIRSMPYWSARLNWKAAPKLRMWVSYSQFNFDKNSPYTFDREDYHKRSDWGAFWTADRLNTFGLIWTRDEVTHRVREKNLYYLRDFHSFTMSFRYRIDTQKWEVKWTLKDF